MTEEQQTTTETGGADTTSGGADTATGGGDKPWYDGYDAEDIGFVQNKKWESPADVLKSYKELEKFKGAPADKLLKLPDDMTDAAAMKDVFKRLGLPDDTTSYALTDLPDGVEINADFAKAAAEKAHAAGVLPEQFKAVYKEMAIASAAIDAEAKAAAKLKGEADLATLEKEWGAAYPERAALAKRAAKTFGASDEVMELLESKSGAAGLIRFMANIGEKLGEDKFVESSDGSRFGKTPEQYRADRQQLNTELSSDPERLAKYLEAKGPDYVKMQQLNKLIAGGA